MTHSHTIRIEFGSAFDMLDFVQVVSDYVGKLAGLDDDALHWVSVAVRESVVNAIKHGNKLDVHKKVNATFELQGFELEITISDEGQGFDPSRLHRPRRHGTGSIGVIWRSPGLFRHRPFEGSATV